MSAIEIPQKGECEYFRAFGVVAVFVAASPANTPCLLGVSRDLGLSLESIRERWHPAVEIAPRDRRRGDRGIPGRRPWPR
jgi:hypothetical protein